MEVVWVFHFFFGVKCIIGILYSCLDNELSGYLRINGKPASHGVIQAEEMLLCLFMLQLNLYYSCPKKKT